MGSGEGTSEQHNNPPIVGLEISDYVRAIIRKNLFAKIKIDEKHDTGFMDHGPQPMRFSPLEWKIDGKIVDRLRQAAERFPYQINSQFVAVTPSENSDNQMFIVWNFDDPKVDNRGLGMSHLQFELPKDMTKSLLDQIKNNPDLLEFFCQEAFPNLDSRGGNRGILRVPSHGFYLIADENLNNLDSSLDPMGGENNLRIFLRKLPFFAYKKGPYGTGEQYRSKIMSLTK